MADEEKIYKCPSCGGFLEWSPSDQKLKCPYCGSEYDVSYFEKDEQEARQDIDSKDYQKGQTTEEAGASAQATDDSGIDPNDLRVYRCQNCGAEIVTDKTTAATTCAFCGSPVVLIEQFDTTFRPKWIVPFRVDREKVTQIYREYIKSRPFTPGTFLSSATIEKIRGVYIPFWLYGMTMQGDLTARGERIFTRSDSRYIYTTHQVFQLRRAGTLQVQNLPVDASSRTPDDAMDSIEPFDFKDKKPFKMSYMPGFYAERYDQDVNFCHERAIRRADQTMHDELMRTTGGYASVQVLNENEGQAGRNGSADYAMLPVYLLSVGYAGKNYLFAINGQTGRIVGDVPVSKGKAAGLTLLVFGITYVVCLLLMMFVF
ncbi:MAG: hypothetical protein SOI56_06425 [Eubacteriales bacterium]|jgi:DNA-directed RNA polymerase subunit RPC12/RpoP